MVRATVHPRLRRTILWLALYGALTALPSVRTFAQTCSGDCNGDADVSIDEIIKGVNIALGFADVSTCPTMDKNHDLEVTVDELITAVANALNGCPTNTPTPTALPMATSAPTATLTPTIGTGNRPPTAVDDAATTLVGESVHITVLANDTTDDRTRWLDVARPSLLRSHRAGVAHGRRPAAAQRSVAEDR